MGTWPALVGTRTCSKRQTRSRVGGSRDGPGTATLQVDSTHKHHKHHRHTTDTPQTHTRARAHTHTAGHCLSCRLQGSLLQHVHRNTAHSSWKRRSRSDAGASCSTLRKMRENSHVRHASRNCVKRRLRRCRCTRHGTQHGTNVKHQVQEAGVCLGTLMVVCMCVCVLSRVDRARDGGGGEEAGASCQQCKTNTPVQTPAGDGCSPRPARAPHPHTHFHTQSTHTGTLTSTHTKNALKPSNIWRSRAQLRLTMVEAGNFLLPRWKYLRFTRARCLGRGNHHQDGELPQPSPAPTVALVHTYLA